jgi:hypothetical protein
MVLCAAAYCVTSHASTSAALGAQPDLAHRLFFFAGFAALGVWAASALREVFQHTHRRRQRAEQRADEQRIAAELGVRALAENDLDALLGETLLAVEQALRSDS